MSAVEVASTHVKVAAAQNRPQQRSADGAHAEDEDLERVRVLGRETERRRELVMQLVDALVERALVQRTVRPVVCAVSLGEEMRGARKKSSKKKKITIWYAIVVQCGNGTWCVDMPSASASGWKPQICGSSIVKCV